MITDRRKNRRNTPPTTPPIKMPVNAKTPICFGMTMDTPHHL